MVSQYPHTIKVTQKGEVTYDAKKNPVAGVDQELYNDKCRAEVNGKGVVMKGDDGEDIKFAYNVYLPKLSIDIPYGSEVEITVEGRTVKGSVKRHYNGQLNSRLWV